MNWGRGYRSVLSSSPHSPWQNSAGILPAVARAFLSLSKGRLALASAERRSLLDLLKHKLSATCYRIKASYVTVRTYLQDKRSCRNPVEILGPHDETASDTGTYDGEGNRDRKSTRLNSSHRCISYAVFCLKKK